jgi:hypothetical protein
MTVPNLVKDILENAEIILYNVMEIWGKERQRELITTDINYNFTISREKAEQTYHACEKRQKELAELPTQQARKRMRIHRIPENAKNWGCGVFMYQNKCKVTDLDAKDGRVWLDKKDSELGELLKTTTPEIKWEIPKPALPKGRHYIYIKSPFSKRLKTLTSS